MTKHGNFETISTSDLANITGGGKLGMAQKLYKWWTGSKKAGTPKQLYTEGRDIIGDVAKYGGGGFGAYQGIKLLNKNNQGAPSSAPAQP